MQVKSLEVQGYGVYRNPIKFPLQELGEAELIAIIGKNGKGKSTFLDLFPAGFLRETPGHGNIINLCHGPDAYVSETYEIGGREIKVEHRIDTTKKTTKQSSFMWVDGEPVASGKVPDFLAKSAEYFPDRGVYFSTVFLAQESDDKITKLKPGPRKELFAKLIGCERFDKISKAAKVRWTAAAQRVVNCNARAEAIAGSIGNQDDIRLGIKEASQALESSRSELDRLSKLKGDQETRFGEYEKEIRRIEADIRAADADLRNRKSTKIALFDRLNRNVEHLKVINKDIEKIEERILALENLPEIVAKGKAAQEDLNKWEVKSTELDCLRDEAELHKRDLQTQIRQYNRDFEAQASERKRLKQARADKLSAPCNGLDIVSDCRFLQRAIEAEKELNKPENDFKEQSGYIAKLEELVEGDASELIKLELGLGEKPDGLDITAGLRAETELGRIEEFEKSKAELRTRAEKGTAIIEGIKKEIKKAEEDIEEAAAVLGVENDKLKAAMDGGPSPRDIDEYHNLGPRIDVLNSNIDETTRKVAGLEARLEKSWEEEERHKAALKEAAEESRQADQWDNVAKAFGKNGIQAMEIDQSLPEVSRLTNELLHECFSNRFTVELRTTRDGKKNQVEGFFIHIIDSETGLAGDEKIISVGLRVIVDEALALACAIYNAQRNEMKLLDLARDECSGALHGDLAVKYIQMLRKAIRIGGFKRCFFIAHQPELWDLADVRMQIEGGKCELI